MSTQAAVRDLFTLHKVAPQWPAALQASVAIVLPLLLFTLVGMPKLGLMASLGSFLVLHLPSRSRRERAAGLPVIMAGFLLAALAGIATSSSVLGSSIAIWIVAVLSSFLGLSLGVGSPGSMFYVLITGAVGALVAPAAAQGAGVDPLLALSMITVGMVIAYLVVLAPLVLPSARRRDAVRYRSRTPWRFAVTADVRRIFLRLTVATTIGVLIGGTLELHRIHWVLLAIIAILQKDSEVRLSVLRSLHRILGTAVALGVFALIALWDPSGIPLVLLIGALMYLWEILAPRNLGLGLVAITPLALVIAAKGADEPLLDIVGVRVQDTALGAGIALAVLIGVTIVRRWNGATRAARRRDHPLPSSAKLPRLPSNGRG